MTRMARGFTLIELILVITIIGVVAVSVTAFLIPAVNAYFDARRRADLTDMADTALRRMSTDIRRAVPNSVVPHGGTCFTLVPTGWGGRYRMASDTVNDTPAPLPCTPGAACTAPLDVGGTVFDALAISPAPPALPAVGDFVVIDNQNGDDVYNGTNRSAITAVATPAATQGQVRITMAGGALPAGYDAGRFVIVPSSEQVVVYSCAGGTLFRNVLTFAAASGGGAAAACGSGVPVATADTVACSFVYSAGASATQQNGLVWMSLTLTQSGESVSLSHSTNVPNVP